MILNVPFQFKSRQCSNYTFAFPFGLNIGFTLWGIFLFNYWNMNCFSFPFLSFQVRVMMETNLRPLIINLIITFCIFLAGGGGSGCGARDRFSHNSGGTKIMLQRHFFKYY